MSDPREILNRIREQANAATPGPWEWEGESEEMWPLGENSLMAVGGASPEGVLMAWGYDAYGITAASDQDAEFIAAARTNVPRLVDALEKVLELHIEGPPFCGHRFSQRKCECGSAWPCPTVEAITRALDESAS